jgi:hypothetical protein
VTRRSYRCPATKTCLGAVQAERISAAEMSCLCVAICHVFPHPSLTMARRSPYGMSVGSSIETAFASITRPHDSRVGPRIDLFEACSAFTRVTACTLALPPYFVARIGEGFNRFVTSAVAPLLPQHRVGSIAFKSGNPRQYDAAVQASSAPPAGR